jgi:KDO2-lipid IV(A) lauroyltransferase
VWLSARLPGSVAAAIGGALGFFAGSVLRLRRARADDHLRIAGVGRDASARARILGKMYHHLGLCVVEFLRLSTWTRAKIDERITFEHFDRLERAVATGHGVIIVTAHFGNWDLLACISARRGIPLHVVTRELKGGGLNRAWMAERERAGVTLHPETGSAGALLAALRAGGVVAFVIDQHMPEQFGVGVPFFGRAASTIDAPAILAARTGAPVFSAFLFREGFERHRLAIGERIPLADGPLREAIVASTARFSKAVEDVVREHPDQWIWMHRRWKLAERVDAARAGEPLA